MRSIWEMTETYAKQLGHVKGASLRWIGKGIRAWDCNAARRVDHFAANSRYVADRIRRYYGKESRVIYPPVRVPAACPKRAPGEGYLMVGELSEYKRADLGVAACVRLGRSLTVIGDGPQMSLLRSMANEGVELLGRTSDEVIREHLSQARALLFCAEEDFGIVPVEAMAAGCPVIAYGRGGGAETVVDGETGVLFDEHTPDGVAGAIERFEELADRLEPEKLHTRALAFAEDRFRSEFAAWISDGLSVSCQVMADSTD